MKKLLVIFGAVLMVSCTDRSGARKQLERNNYKPLDVGGYSLFGGSQDDVFKTKFIAIAPNGDTVRGVVTKGWFKGSTIRLDD